VVAQKVHLSKQKSQLSKQDAAYTDILRAFSDQLEAYFNDTLIDFHDLPFHEIFVYDLKSPHREVFTPRPRHAVERALSSPHDYLDCDCCAPDKVEGDEATLSSTQPATAVLYQLYLESGSLINVSDLWQAFQAVMNGEKEEGDLMSLFQRGLAELRYLGLVKSTRKRADHVAKVAWRGL
jgi:origin recognition complex subunit 3